jgi:hypothetical protein
VQYAGDKTMIVRLLIFAAMACLAFPIRGNAENIVCPPQNEMAEGFDKWTADYSGGLDEVWLSRQFLRDQEGAVIRCKRTIGSVQIMLQRKSCRAVPGAGKAETTPYGNSEDTVCKLGRANSAGTNDKTCIIVCK